LPRPSGRTGGGVLAEPRGSNQPISLQSPLTATIAVSASAVITSRSRAMPRNRARHEPSA
jgi:hypothetical protein